MENREWKECPLYVIALLRMIDSELCRVMWNINQKEYDSPFCNTGNKFECDVFEVEAYNWDDDITQEFNFWYKPGDIKIAWYKYLGRDTIVLGEYTPDQYIQMFDDCIEIIQESDDVLY